MGGEPGNPFTYSSPLPTLVRHLVKFICFDSHGIVYRRVPCTVLQGYFLASLLRVVLSGWG